MNKEMHVYIMLGSFSTLHTTLPCTMYAQLVETTMCCKGWINYI